MKRKTSLKIVALLAIAVLLFSGCTIRGGGRLMDARHPRCQTTFSIQANIEDPCCDGDLEKSCLPDNACGKFRYYDKQNCVQVCGEFDGGIAFDIDECGIGAVATVWGEYTDGCVTGPVCILLYDSQFNGACRNSYDPCGPCWEEFKPDRLGIMLFAPDDLRCFEPVYEHCAPLARGNIQIKAPVID